MAIHWRVDNGPPIVVFGWILPPLINKKKIKKKYDVKVGPPLTKLSESARDTRIPAKAQAILHIYAALIEPSLFVYILKV